MLTSPTCDANGYSNTFNASDIASLRAVGVNRAQATEAANWMKEAELFLAAYGRQLNAAAIDRLLNALGVRMVMTVHKKTCETRASFSSLRQVAAAFYAEAKEKDDRLPKWHMLPEESNQKTNKATNKIAVLRETGDIVTESILAEKGFEVGKQVVQVESGNVYMLSALNADEKTATLDLQEKANPKSKAKPCVTVNRSELLLAKEWQPCTENKVIFFDCKQLSSPMDNFDLRASIMSGMFKSVLAAEFNKSSYDSDCKISTSPSIKVFASKPFKTGAFKLVGLTNNISVAPIDKVTLAASKSIGSGKDWKAFARSSNDQLTGKSKPDVYIISGLFRARSSSQL